MGGTVGSAMRAAALSLPIACSLSPSLAKSFGGTYTLTFYVDPGSHESAVYCVNFTQTGNIAGFSNSGTFIDTNNVLGGDFEVDGKTFHMQAIYSPYPIGSIDLIGKYSKSPAGSFDDFNHSVFPPEDEDSGTFTLTSGCTDEPIPPHRGSNGTR